MSLNIAIIGAGAMALRFLDAVKDQVQSVSFIAAYDPLPSQCERIAASVAGITIHPTLTDLFADSRVDAVYIATPVHTHAELTIAAARAGKHVLCEKPMALTAEECKAMIEAGEANNAIVQIGYMMRFHPIHQYMREQVASGALGRIKYVYAERTFSWDFKATGLPDHRRWFFDKQRSGGGAFMDLGCHILDLLLYILDSRVEDGTLTVVTDPEHGIDTSAIASMRLEHQVLATLMTSWQVPVDDNQLLIYGERGALVGTRTIGPYTDGWVDHIHDGKRERIDIAYKTHYVSELEHFEGCVRQGKEPLTSARNCLKSEEGRMLLFDSINEGQA